MDTAIDSVLVIGRILTILPLLLFITLFMGKRAIGQLPIFDFLIIITLGSVVGADIADPDINHIHTGIAIIALASLQRLVSHLKIKYRKVGRLITFEPTIVVYNGKIIRDNLRRNRFSLDNLLQMLREKDIFQVNDIHLGVLEANGSLSVVKKGEKETVSKEDLNIQKTALDLAYPVIVEGNVYSSVLKDLSLNKAWLFEQLHARGIDDLNTIFYASVNDQHEIHISMKNEKMDKYIMPH